MDYLNKTGLQHFWEKIKSRFTTVENSIATTNTNLSTTNTNISALESKVNYYRRNNCNMVIIGDSWSVGGSASSTSKRYSTILAKSLQMAEFNFGVGGAGFNVSGNQFITQVNKANTDMTAAQKADTGIVLVCGLVNDLRHGAYESGYTLSDCTNAMTECLNKIAQVFPDSLIVCAIGNTLVDYYPDTWQHWVSYMQRQAEMWAVNNGYPLLLVKNLGACVNGVPSNYKSDYLHLTDTGHALFAGHILNAIMGGDQRVYYYLGSSGGTITWASNVSSRTKEPHVFRDNDRIVITCGDINFSSAISSNTVIGNLSNVSYAPNSTIYFPAFMGNVMVGSIAFTASGSVRFIPNSGGSATKIMFSDMSWTFTGNASSPKT